MDQELKFLKTAAVIFKVLAWVSAIFFLVVTMIVLFGAAGPDTPRAASIVFLLGGGFYFLVLFGLSEALKLLFSLSAKVDKILGLLSGKPVDRNI
ncbi:MAG: hypothetical protein GY853_03655 [PVC group bacterium]|nr:hypothetical protein [PVC group bacterium]